jgi:SAM-dependent methyltransferase
VLTVELDRLELGADDRVLDLGCGGGRHAYGCARTGASVVALDAGQRELTEVAEMLAAMVAAGEIPAGAHQAVSRGDARALPFADRSFSVVIASEILEHVRDDEAMLAEIVRVLRPGGRCVVTVPRFGPELVNWALSGAYHRVPGGHLRIYRRRVLAERLRTAGLSPTAAHHAHALHSPYWWLRCLVGVANETHPLVRSYHRFLVWEMTAAPPLTRRLEAALDPVLGKSLVLYCTKGPA